MSWIKSILVDMFQNEYVSKLQSAMLGKIGMVSGVILGISINWDMIYERAIETAILALIGSIFGGLGGLIIALIKKKILDFLDKDNNKIDK